MIICGYESQASSKSNYQLKPCVQSLTRGNIIPPYNPKSKHPSQRILIQYYGNLNEHGSPHPLKKNNFEIITPCLYAVPYATPANYQH
jgi:hypothetical protein